MPPNDPIVDKTTRLVSAQPIEFTAIPFAKGYRIKVSVAFDPQNTVHLDQFLVKGNNFQKALEGFIKNTVEGTLKSHLISDASGKGIEVESENRGSIDL